MSYLYGPIGETDIVSVKALIVNPSGEVAFGIRPARDERAGQLDLFGGKPEEENEPFRQTVIREVLEETGLEIEPLPGLSFEAKPRVLTAGKYAGRVVRQFAYVAPVDSFSPVELKENDGLVLGRPRLLQRDPNILMTEASRMIVNNLTRFF